MLILLVTGITYWIHWGVGMMFSINLGREILAASREKGYKIHQPAFVALSYSTFAAGIGLSQAAPILGATPGALQDLVVSDAVKAYIPETVPLTQTVLSPINLLHCGLILLVVIVLGWALYPKKDSQIVELSDELYEDIKKSGEAQLSPPQSHQSGGLDQPQSPVESGDRRVRPVLDHQAYGFRRLCQHLSG